MEIRVPSGFKVKKIVKRDGRVVDFDPMRIANAIKKAMLSVNQYDEDVLRKVVGYILTVIDDKFGAEKIPHVEDVQDIVELALVKFDLYEVAKAYILYRKEREKIRKEKMLLLNKDYVDEVDKRFSLNAIRLLAARYLLKDEEGRVVESPKQMFQRVAMLVVIPDILYDSRIFDKDGRQKVKPIEEFSPSVWEGKVGLGRLNDGTYRVTWNRYHLERMKALYDELNQQGKMKVSWSAFFQMLLLGEFDSYYENFLEYYNVMVEKKFLPSSPTLFNAGTRLGQLSACFVLDIDDNIESIMEAAKEAAIIFKTGGGIGINYSKLRPEGDIVSSTHGVASGPVSFMRIIDTVTDVVKQGGRRRGANMGILEIWHPDIEKFITAKSKPNVLTNFNISVMITPNFWEYYKENKLYPLVNPRDGSVWRHIKPRQIFRTIAEMAWKTGDPGVLFMDNINKRNILRKALGDIRATNPCGEEPLYPYESCNLGSINLYAFIEIGPDGKASFNWEEYRRVIRVALRFLDNVIDVNRFPFDKIEKSTKLSRKVGLGVMGLADTLFALKIPYNSEEGFKFMRIIAENLTYYALDESAERAKKRGVFPYYHDSGYVDGEMPVEGYYRRELWTLDWEKLAEKVKKYGVRNAEVTTIAPTGSISMIADTSSGIEPQFALVYEKRVTVGQFFYVDYELERQLKERGLYDEKILKEIADNGGSLQELDSIPDDMKRIFLVAYDVPWWDHVRAQAEISLWICAAVSKTINMPNWVTPDDIEKAYLFAYKLGLKGITVYRDGSKNVQVLITPSQRKGNYVLEIQNKTFDLMKKLGIEPPKPESYIHKFSSEAETLARATMGIVSQIKAARRTEEPQNDFETCPMCGSTRIIYEEDCVKCLDCGWVACIVA